ncbi:MAG: hypothetical protein ACE14S_10770 [Candidatus Bathyarchaeia archaeon]
MEVKLLVTDEQLKVLKLMSEVTGTMDMNDFAKKLCLTTSQALEKFQELVKAGFMKKTAAGFSMTEKGKLVLKAAAQVPAGSEFSFYLTLDQPTGMSAASLKDFHELVKRVDAASLEFHLDRGDFENWVRSTVNDAAFADELVCLKARGRRGGDLRQEIVKALEARYSL